jgi:hypothetical protein
MFTSGGQERGRSIGEGNTASAKTQLNSQHRIRAQDRDTADSPLFDAQFAQ